MKELFASIFGFVGVRLLVCLCLCMHIAGQEVNYGGGPVYQAELSLAITSSILTEAQSFCIDPVHRRMIVLNANSSSSFVAVSDLNSPGSISLLAGAQGSSGFLDSIGTSARFNQPFDCVAVPNSDLIYVSDSGNSVIRKVNTTNGNVTTLLGIAGHIATTDGAFSSVSFSNPRGLQLNDDATILWILDRCVIRQVDLVGATVTTIAGNQSAICTHADGVGTAASFGMMDYIIYDDEGGYLYVNDELGYIRQINLTTKAVTTVASRQMGLGIPIGLTFAKDRNSLLVTDQQHYAVMYVNILYPNDTSIFLGGYPYGVFTEGIGPMASITNPSAIKPNPTGSGMILGTLSQFIGNVTIIGPEYGNQTRYNYWPFIGSPNSVGAENGPVSSAAFESPVSTCMDPNLSILYIVDNAAGNIRRVNFSTGGIITFAGNNSNAVDTDGVGSSARFKAPNDCVVTSDSIYVTTSGNYVRKIATSTATATTFAGNGSALSVNGIGTTAAINAPKGIVYDSLRNNLYVVDSGSCTVRSIAIATSTVSTLAGLACGTSVDGIGSAAIFGNLNYLTIDSTNTYLLLGDTPTVAGVPARIRKLNIANSQVTSILPNTAHIFLQAPISVAFASSAQTSILVADKNLCSVFEVDLLTLDTTLAVGQFICASATSVRYDHDTKAELLPIQSIKADLSNPNARFYVGSNASQVTQLSVSIDVHSQQTTASPTSTILGDPQFVGFLGQRYQVHGQPNIVYNLFSSPQLQWNSFFGFLSRSASRDLPTLRQKLFHTADRDKALSDALPPNTASWSHPGSYLTAFGLRIRDNNIAMRNMIGLCNLAQSSSKIQQDNDNDHDEDAVDDAEDEDNCSSCESHKHFEDEQITQKEQIARAQHNGKSKEAQHGSEIVKRANGVRPMSSTSGPTGDIELSIVSGRYEEGMKLIVNGVDITVQRFEEQKSKRLAQFQLSDTESDVLNSGVPVESLLFSFSSSDSASKSTSSSLSISSFTGFELHLKTPWLSIHVVNSDNFLNIHSVQLHTESIQQAFKQAIATFETHADTGSDATFDGAEHNAERAVNIRPFQDCLKLSVDGLLGRSAHVDSSSTSGGTNSRTLFLSEEDIDSFQVDDQKLFGTGFPSNRYADGSD